MNPIKVLVVDDEKEICEITRRFLLRRGYVVSTATNEEEAIILAKQENPQIVLLDVRLGAVSGIDVLRKIKEINNNIKVIMVTGLADQGSIEEAKSAGADDFITKPFTPDYLAKVIKDKTAP